MDVSLGNLVRRRNGLAPRNKIRRHIDGIRLVKRRRVLSFHGKRYIADLPKDVSLNV
jgi:hypothetical protein